MQQSRVHEGIDVYAAFMGGKIAPRAFRWSGRTYNIEHIHQHWTGRNGNIMLYYFAVTSGGNAYKLCLNSQQMEWMLEEVYA